MTDWLIDKSAYVRLAQSPDAAAWANRVERGRVRITAVTHLELGYSTRSGRDLRDERTGVPLALMPVEYLTPVIEDRAVAVQQELADRGHHRAASVPDLLVAAAAEQARLTVLHVDSDFDLIAGVTGQPVERLIVP